MGEVFGRGVTGIGGVFGGGCVEVEVEAQRTTQCEVVVEVVWMLW